MDITKMIKKILIDENITVSELANKLNTTQPNLSAKFRRNDFRVSEIEEITSALGYSINLEIKKDLGNKDV